MGSTHSSSIINNSSYSKKRAFCEENDSAGGNIIQTSTPPPTMTRPETIEQKAWRKITSQPLVPIGCVATAYFLISGIRSFQKRDPVRSQRMMRNRVAAQFVTLACFIGYMGYEQADFRIAPMFQDSRRITKEEEQNEK